MTKKEIAKAQKRSWELLEAWLELTPEERRKIDEAGMNEWKPLHEKPAERNEA